jgi:hypothetical protein
MLTSAKRPDSEFSFKFLQSPVSSQRLQQWQTNMFLIKKNLYFFPAQVLAACFGNFRLLYFISHEIQQYLTYMSFVFY